MNIAGLFFMTENIILPTASYGLLCALVLAVMSCESSGSTDLEKHGAGQNLGLVPNPALPWEHETLLSYAPFQGTLVVDGISKDDPAQGYLGDCSAIASFVALANQNASWIENAITQDTSGYIKVRLHVSSDDAAGNLPDPVTFAADGLVKDYLVSGLPGRSIGLDRIVEPYTLYEFLITSEFPAAKDRPLDRPPNFHYARSSAPGELWVAALEKGLAVYRSQYKPSKVVSGYDSLDYGNPMSVITGVPTTTLDLGSLDLAIVASALQAAFATGPAAVIVATWEEQTLIDAQLLARHAYALTEIAGSGDTMQVRLRNPHGPQQDIWLSIQSLMSSFAWMKILGHPSQFLSAEFIAHASKFTSNYATDCVINGVGQNFCNVLHPGCLADTRLPIDDASRQAWAKTDPQCNETPINPMLSCGLMASMRGITSATHEVHCVFDDNPNDAVPSIAAYEADPAWTRLDSLGARTWDCQSCWYRTL